LNKVKSTKEKKDKTVTNILNQTILEAIQSVKGKNIVLLDLTQLHDAPTDYFILCEGDSVTQIRAISQRIVKEVKEVLGERPNHTEGKDKANWVLVDYFTTVVHVFHPETRKFYGLEDLWSDAKRTEIQSL
jgi:ribosome-associated protein